MMVRLNDRSVRWPLIIAVPVLVACWLLPHGDAAAEAEQKTKQLVIILPDAETGKGSPSAEQLPSVRGAGLGLELVRLLLVRRLAEYEVTLASVEELAAGGLAADSNTLYLASEFVPYGDRMLWRGSLREGGGAAQVIGPVTMLEEAGPDLDAFQQIAGLVAAQISDLDISAVPNVFFVCTPPSERLPYALPAILVAQLQRELATSSLVSLGEGVEQASARCPTTAAELTEQLNDASEDALVVIVAADEGEALFPIRSAAQRANRSIEKQALADYIVKTSFRRGEGSTEGPIVEAGLLLDARTRSEEVSTFAKYLETIAYTRMAEANEISSKIRQAASSVEANAGQGIEGGEGILALPALQAAAREATRPEVRALLLLAMTEIYEETDSPNLASKAVGVALDLLRPDQGLQSSAPETYAAALQKAGDLAFEAEDYEAALARYGDAIAIVPELANVLERRGYAAFLAGNYDLARTSMQKAVDKQEATALSYLILGTIEKDGLKRLKEGAAKFTDRQGEFLSAMLEVGFTNLNRGYFELSRASETAGATLRYAMEAVDSALAIEPQPRAHLIRARIELLLAQLAEGEDTTGPADGEDPKAPYHDSIADFEAALRLEVEQNGILSETYQIARLELAETLLLATDYERAFAEAEKFRSDWKPAEPLSAVASLIEAAASYLLGRLSLAEAERSLSEKIRPYRESVKDPERPGWATIWSFDAVIQFSCKTLNSPKSEGMLRLIEMVRGPLGADESPARKLGCAA
jgi:tetratricopeptide (TPR) repeat protein